jgi:hypothetical protein
MWTSTYHTPGAADRLAEAVRTFRWLATEVLVQTRLPIQ